MSNNQYGYGENIDPGYPGNKIPKNGEIGALFSAPLTA
jgi:hypothetical protein